MTASVKPRLESLETRTAPAVATFSNGLLEVAQCQSVAVAADAGGNVSVTDQGQAVPIGGVTGPVLAAQVKLLVEIGAAGGRDEVFSSNLLGVPTTMIGAGSGLVNFLPVARSTPVTALGSSAPGAINVFKSNPGGLDVFQGGSGPGVSNVFIWPPGTGSNVYSGGARAYNSVLVVGQTPGSTSPEQDRLDPDGAGGVIYSRVAGAQPFSLFTTTIQSWTIQPGADGSTLTLGDLRGTATRRVELDGNQGVLDARASTAPLALFTVGTDDVLIRAAYRGHAGN